MALHFSKYTGNFVAAKLDKNKTLLKANLVDTFVICLASSNMFNIEIAKLNLLSKVRTKDFKKVGSEIFEASEYIHQDIYSFVSDNMALCSGKIAKAIESLDHLEPYPYREEFEKHLEKILGIVFVASTFLDFDLILSAKKRIENVEKKSIFYDDYLDGNFEEKTN